jgi:hypothetical protein
LRVYSLDNHVVSRDPMGNVLEAITLERINRNTAPPEVLASSMTEGLPDDDDKGNAGPRATATTRHYRGLHPVLARHSSSGTPSKRSTATESGRHQGQVAD